MEVLVPQSHLPSEFTVLERFFPLTASTVSSDNPSWVDAARDTGGRLSKTFSGPFVLDDRNLDTTTQVRTEGPKTSCLHQCQASESTKDVQIHFQKKLTNPPTFQKFAYKHCIKAR